MAEQGINVLGAQAGEGEGETLACALAEHARFRIVDWNRAVYAIGEKKYISICTVVDGGGNSAVVYRTGYNCGLDLSKDPPRPAHQLAVRSVDVKNPEGLGGPTFVLQPDADETALDFTQPVEVDQNLWREWSPQDGVFSSLFWHNPHSYSGGTAEIAEAAGGKGCLYDLHKLNEVEFELRLVFAGDQNAPEVDQMLTKGGWWKPV